MAWTLVRCPAYHLSVGTPKGSSTKPGKIGRPSCHVSVEPAFRAAAVLELEEVSPMTITSSSGSALSNANASEDDEASLVP